MAFKITLPNDATSGSFTLTVNSKTTEAIDHPFAASDVKAKLVAIGLSASKVKVKGPNGGPFEIEGVTDPITADGANLGGATKTIVVVDTAAAGAGLSFKDLRGTNSHLIRKFLGGVIFIGPADADIPDEWCKDADGGLVNLKALGYMPLGWLTKSEGIEFSRETENSDVESFGSPEPTRTDITKDVTSAQFTCQETNRAVLELYYGVDLSKVQQSNFGDIVFDNATSPETKYYRMISVAHDGVGKNAFYFIRVMPKATVSEVQSLTVNSENESKYGLTLKATVDDKVGYAIRNIYTGPKAKDWYSDMGFA